MQVNLKVGLTSLSSFNDKEVNTDVSKRRYSSWNK